MMMITKKRTIVNVIKTPKSQTCIKYLLKLEEALFRNSAKNYVIMTDGIPKPTIVLGCSGKVHEMVHDDINCSLKGVEIIKRFTGGGTVVCDLNTQFVSFVMNAKEVYRDDFLRRKNLIDDGDNEMISLAEDGLFPRPIMRWTGDFYERVFNEKIFSSSSSSSTATAKKKKMNTNNNYFSLRENDYVFGDKKFGGNAQSISKNRFIHHTSFLYDYDEEMMKLLKSPKKQPEYRENRDHLAFVQTLKSKYDENDIISSGRRELFFDAVYNTLNESGFVLRSMPFDEAESILFDYNETKQSTVKIWCSKLNNWELA
jgi:lipoate-protein ligase A